MFRKRNYFNIIRFTDTGISDVGINKDTWAKNGSISFENYAAIQDPYISTRFKSCYCLNENSYYQNNAECKLEKDGRFTISFWFKLHNSAIIDFDNNKNSYIPGVEVSDENGNNIKLIPAYHGSIPGKPSVALLINDKLIYDCPYTPDNEWHNILFSRGELIVERLFFDGKKWWEYPDGHEFGRILKNIKLGNPYGAPKSGAYEYELDQLHVCNDSTYTDDFELVDIRQTVERFPLELIELPDTNTRIEPNYVYGAPFNYNTNHTRWDNVVDNVEITRPVYFKKSSTADLKMKEKILFDEDNETSHSNFKFYSYPEKE